MGARKIVYTSKQPAYGVDRRGRIVVWNAAAERAFGYPDSKALAEHCWELLCGEDEFGNQHCREGCPMRTMAFQNTTVKRHRVQFKTASNERKGFTVNTVILPDGPGKEILVHSCHPDADEDSEADTGLERAPSELAHLPGILTRREIDVLELLASGKRTRYMAKILCIAEPTVRKYVTKVMNKLGTDSRLEAIIQGQWLGLL